MEDGFYGNNLLGLQAYLQNGTIYDRAFFSLPEEIQMQVNERAQTQGFSSVEELRSYIQTLSQKA